MWANEVSLKIQKSGNLQDWESLDLIRNDIAGTDQNIFYRVKPEMTDEMPVLAQLKPGTRIRETYSIYGMTFVSDSIITSTGKYFNIEANGDYKLSEARLEMNAEGNAEITIQRETDFEKPSNIKEESTLTRYLKYVFDDVDKGRKFELRNDVWLDEYDTTFEVFAPSGLAPDHLLGFEQQAFFYYEHFSFPIALTLSFDSTDPHRLQVDYDTRIANYTYHYEKLNDSVGSLKTGGELASGEPYFGEYTLYFYSATAAFITGYEVNTTNGVIQAWGFLGDEGSLPIDYSQIIWPEDPGVITVSPSGPAAMRTLVTPYMSDASDSSKVSDPLESQVTYSTEIAIDFNGANTEDAEEVIEDTTLNADVIPEEQLDVTDETLETVMTQAHPVVVLD